MVPEERAAAHSLHRERLADALIVLGAACVAAGAGMIYVPAGLMVGGVELVLISVFAVSGPGS